jgi:anaerobic dimethyl sulfoxide reductase subunit B (iron-sulfur subunit)
LCLKACPTKAYYRRPTDGAILIDPNKCVGCRFCERFCPYGAPQYNVTLNKMQKCTMCWDRIERQMEPACAAICPTAALQFKRFDEIKDAYSTTFEKFSTPATTTPAIRFVTTDWKKG